MINVALPIGYMLGAPFCGRLGDRCSATGSTCSPFFCPAHLYLVCTYSCPGGSAWSVTALYAVSMLAADRTTLWATAQAKTRCRYGSHVRSHEPFPLAGMAVMQGVTGAIVNRAGKWRGLRARGYRNAFLFSSSSRPPVCPLCRVQKASFHEEAIILVHGQAVWLVRVFILTMYLADLIL